MTDAKDVFQQLRLDPDNNRCVDCGASQPQWVSVPHGVWICYECSGKHRNLGTHLSFVQSITMDKWTEPRLALMSAGGNSAFSAFMQQMGEFNTDIKQRYSSFAAALYREKLSAVAAGRPWAMPSRTELESKRRDHLALMEEYRRRAEMYSAPKQPARSFTPSDRQQQSAGAASGQKGELLDDAFVSLQHGMSRLGEVASSVKSSISEKVADVDMSAVKARFAETGSTAVSFFKKWTAVAAEKITTLATEAASAVADTPSKPIISAASPAAAGRRQPAAPAAGDTNGWGLEWSAPATSTSQRNKSSARGSQQADMLAFADDQPPPVQQASLLDLGDNVAPAASTAGSGWDTGDDWSAERTQPTVPQAAAPRATASAADDPWGVFGGSSAASAKRAAPKPAEADDLLDVLSPGASQAAVTSTSSAAAAPGWSADGWDTFEATTAPARKTPTTSTPQPVQKTSDIAADEDNWGAWK